MAEPMTQALERVAALMASAQTRQAVEIRRALIKGTAVAAELIRQEARTTLPKAGGVNEWVADAVTKITPTSGARSAGVTIRTRKTGHDLVSINEGRLRHPTFGQPKPVKWGMTEVRPGFFTRPLELKVKPEVTALMRHAMYAIVRSR